MDHSRFTLSTLKQDLIDNNLHLKAVIQVIPSISGSLVHFSWPHHSFQDILAFRGTLTELETLNEAGREKITSIRRCIDRLDNFARDEGDIELTKSVENHRQQLYRTTQAFRKANISTMLEIEKSDKQDLFSMSTEPKQQELRNRGNATSTTNPSGHARASLLSQQDSVTEKMLSITRHLSETTQKSAATLEQLAASSTSVESTRDELAATGGSISLSGKLLTKYGRRECTDKVLLFIAFIFFIMCVIYIVYKRLF